VDIHASDWLCAPEGSPERPVLRLGFNYVRGMREAVAQEMVRERERRPFASIADLVRRVPALPKDTLRRLAHIGALNSLTCGADDRFLSSAVGQASTLASRHSCRLSSGNEDTAAPTHRGARTPACRVHTVEGTTPPWGKPPGLPFSQAWTLAPPRHNAKPSVFTGNTPVDTSSTSSGHRRDALWQAEWAARPAGPLLEPLEPAASASPLKEMTPLERTYADFESVGLTVGRPPVAFYRDQLNKMGVTAAADLKKVPSGKRVRIAGAVICRQRPETAKGFAFLSIEDETGISNAIVQPQYFVANKLVLTTEPYLLLEGQLQNQSGAISIRVDRAAPLHLGPATIRSHDFC